ncbi:MAG TPA: uridine kinase [Deinococcales bacterium]|nr:uridine kinase [Deinococcales bacterium]
MQRRPLVIGLAGGTGSGKTTITHALLESAADKAAVIPQDAYYRSHPDLPFEERALINYDEPAAFDTPLLVSQLKDLAAGQAVERPVYDFSRHLRSGKTILVESRPLIIVEGILALHEASLRALFDVRVFVDAPADERFIRRLERDVRERQRSAESVISQYRATVRPMHDLYVEPSRQHADLIVPEGGRNEVALRVLAAFVRDFLSGGQA